MIYHDNLQDPRYSQKVMLHPRIIAKIKHECERRKRKKKGEEDAAYTLLNLQDELEEFIKHEIEKFDPKLHKAFPTQTVSIPTLSYAMTRNRDGSGAKPALRNLLCYFAFGKNWIDTIASIGGNLKDEYDAHDALKAHNKKKSLRVQLSKVDTTSDAPPIIIGEGRFENILRTKVQMLIQQHVPLAWDWVEPTPERIQILKDLHPFQSVLGELPWELIERRLVMREEMLRIVAASHNNDETIIGFYLLYPITKKCAGLIESGAITGSTQFELQHLCADLKKSDAMYISLVFSLDSYTCKKKLMQKLNSDIATLTTHYPNIKRLYTRPITNEGEESAVKYLFQPLNDDAGIFYQDTKSLSSRFKNSK